VGDFLRTQGSVSRSRTLAGLGVGRSVPHFPHSGPEKSVGGNRLVNTEDRTGRTYGTERTYGLKSNPGAQQAPAEHRTLEHPEIMLYQGRQMSIISLPAEADRRPSH
jgi:hypothetical protein